MNILGKKMKNLLAKFHMEPKIVNEYLFNNVYSITLQAKDLPFFSNGKGWSKEEALLGAYGEMCERLLTKNYFEDYFLDNIYPDAKNCEFLNNDLKQFYKIDKLDKEDLIDFSSSSEDILSIPFKKLNSDEIIYFPINLIQNLYASNGMAFYPDKKIAFENALSEIIERFVKFEVIKNGYSLPKIKHKLNSENIQIYDASLNSKYPVMAASYIKENNILLTFGCDKIQEKAIEKAYFELMQGREDFKDIGGFSNDLDEVSDTFNLETHFISSNGLIHTNFLKTSNFKAKKWEFKNYFIFDKEIFYREYKVDNFYAYQVIIPSISEIYPIEDLIYNNKNQGKFYRDLVLNYKNYNKTEIIEYFEDLNPYMDLGKFIGVIFKTPITITEFIQNLENDTLNLKFDKIHKKIEKVNFEINSICFL
jgi:ribosomal protein S12 methylthiotransferase accessory factor